MEDVTIISYPGAKDRALLSLTDTRSKYMLPFAGKFRVVDFTIRNSSASGARRTIIYSNHEDSLEQYVEQYGPYRDMKFPPVKVVSREYSDIRFCYNLILDSNTDYYIIYNGDNPALIDFAELLRRYRLKRGGAILYKLKFGERATLAHTVLVTNQKNLLAVINQAIDEERHAPNIFEMIINILINRGIATDVFPVHYWPIKNIPDYYAYNMEIQRSPGLFALLFKESGIRSQIRGEGFASIGKNGRIVHSFLSDSCRVDGTITNSIIFPGVEIGEKANVRDSIILPYVRIGAFAHVTRAIVDERTDFTPENGQPNIGGHVRIGSEDEQLKNNDFPRYIYRSITLIGKDCDVPEGSRIGGACYIASGKGRDYFSRTKYLYDGLSIVK